MAAPRVELLLARHADTAWRGAIRPWLEGGHGRLVRSYVVVATRGQAQGLKQRCVAEELALLGVEFLTPGLARKKWLPLVKIKPALGRELLLFELRVVIAQRLQSLEPDDPRQGLLKSLQSDAERALDDFDELLKAGFTAADFGAEPLCEVFGEFVKRVEELGYGLGAKQSERAALEPVPEDAPRIGGRLLVYGLGAEAWGEFFNVAAFVRRFDEITVVLPEPEFRGNRALDEKWVELWQTFLGANALPIDAPSPEQSCGAIAGWWRGAGQNEPIGETAGASPALSPRILVGRTRDEEMKHVADEVIRLLDDGARDIAVVFPKADAAHAGLARRLGERGIAFVDLLPGVGATSLEVQLQRALLVFYERGARLEELLALWPLLRASGLTEVTAGSARDVCERLFDERQTHAVAAYAEILASRTRPEWKEVNRVVSLLLPAWPAELTLSDALARFKSVCEKLEVIYPETWCSLAVFAECETRVFPATEVFAVQASFLPEKTPVSGSASSGFARVTLTTLRRAEGLAWSHVIFAESNAGVWPTRQRASGWLPDEQRAEINLRGRFSLGVFTADDRAWLEKRSYAALARDTQEQVVFSAALVDEAEPENTLTPNSWLERVLWHTAEPGVDIQETFAALAPPPPSSANEPSESVKSWLAIWQSRRDPLRAFDEYFLSVDPARIRPERLSARLIEAAVADPVELWFGAVLGVSRVKQGPLLRSRQRSLGQLAHRVVGAALRGECAEGSFFEKPERAVVESRLAEELRKLRALWPADRFWDSFHAGLAQICGELLNNLFQLETGSVVATEMRLPAGATIPLGADGERLSVSGRMDVIIADRAEWGGATLDIVDFKTGKDAELTAARMASKGAGLQLGVYLAAMQSLGAQAGRVWMVKPDSDGVAAMDMRELPEALLSLERIRRHFGSGRYGALTADKTQHSSGGFVWPLACVPVSAAVLREKFAVTFGEVVTEAEETDNE